MNEGEVFSVYLVTTMSVGALGIIILSGIPQALVIGAIGLLERRGNTRRILAEARLLEAKNAARSTPGGSDA